MIKYCLIITATIHPGEYTSILNSSDTHERENEYKNALKFWLSSKNNQIGNIVFCENSNADLNDLKSVIAQYSAKQAIQRKVEWLSYDGNTRPQGFHYGYAELGSIDYAVTHSKLLQGNSHFIKATGRLTFPTIDRLLSALPNQFDLAADWVRFTKDKSNPRRVRTQLLFINTDFYRQTLLNARNSMTNGTSHTERFLALILWPIRNQHKLCFRFPYECQPRGVSASFGTHYDKGLSKVKSIVRGLARRVLPSLWI